MGWAAAVVVALALAALCAAPCPLLTPATVSMARGMGPSRAGSATLPPPRPPLELGQPLLLLDTRADLLALEALLELLLAAGLWLGRGLPELLRLPPAPPELLLTEALLLLLLWKLAVELLLEDAQAELAPL